MSSHVDLQRPITPAQTEQSASQQDAPKTFAQPVTVSSPDGTVTARMLTVDERRSAAVQGVTHGTDAPATPTPTTRATTRDFPPGTIDAGGPYGGPTTFEGTSITFSVR